MRPETKKRLAKAVGAVVMWDLDHSDDCFHRSCDDPDCAGGDDCDANLPPGSACECFRAEVDELTDAAKRALAEEP